MKIQQSHPIQSSYNNKINENNKFKTNKTQQDCFTKSKNISFGGDPFLDALFSILDEFSASLDRITELYEKELCVQALISVLSKKQNRNFLTIQKNMPVGDLMKSFGSNYQSLTGNFKNAGINTTWQLDTFLRTYSKSPATRKAFEGQEFEAIEIYGLLNKKDDFPNFGDILLYVYNQEEDQRNPNFDRLNEYPEFLKQLGISKTNEFESKFSHLKPQFNDFEKISDKVEAIDYVKSTYDSKIAQLESIVGKDAQKIYSTICDVVDYYFDENEGKSLQELENVLDLAMQENKLKAQSLRLFMNSTAFDSTQEKVSFFEFLKECDVTINDFNAISKKSFIIPEDNDILSQIINKKHLSACISEIKGIDKEEAVDFYKRFSDVINAIYDDENGDLDNLRVLIGLTEKLNIKNSDGILRLYQDATGDKKKALSANEISEFIGLFAISDAKEVLEKSKKQKIPAITILKTEKEKFKKAEKEIEDFVRNDKSAFFAGQSALSIYKNYYSLFQDNTGSVANILQNIVDFNISSSQQYQQKAQAIASFKPYFENTDSLIEFINSNEINIEDDNPTYKENCLNILDAIYDEKQPEKSKERIDFYSNSGFLIKSQNRLSEFLAKMPDKELKTEILSLIADKKVPSLNQLEKFFRQYNLSNISGRSLVNFLENLPENIDFTTGTKLLESLQNEINQRNIPLQITAENIETIDIESIEEEIKPEHIISIMNRVYNASENKNFLAVMPANRDQQNQHFRAKKIAEEIVFKMNSSSESYHNLTRLLGLEKSSLGLKEDASEYLHIKAIQEKLPEEFVDFVNSNEWLNFNDDENEITPSLILHARLRAIDRFALAEATSIEDLYSQETKNKLQELFKSVYTDMPIDIKGTDRTKRIITNHQHNGNVIEAVFAPNGTMITIVQKKK